MRYGPMIIEEIEENDELIESDVYSLDLMRDANRGSFNDSNDVIKNIDVAKNNPASKCCSVDENRDFHRINYIDDKFGDFTKNSEINNHLPSTIYTQESNDKKIKEKVSTNSFQNQHITNCDNSCLETKLSQLTKNKINSESIKNNPTTKNSYENKLEHQAKGEQEKGNKCFKRKQYTLAIDCYTRSLEYCPINAAVLANRALCFINVSTIVT